MAAIEYCKKALNLINNMKNENLKEKLKNIGDYITEIRNKKIKELNKSIKSLKMMKNMNLETC